MRTKDKHVPMQQMRDQKNCKPETENWGEEEEEENEVMSLVKTELNQYNSV